MIHTIHPFFLRPSAVMLKTFLVIWHSSLRSITWSYYDQLCIKSLIKIGRRFGGVERSFISFVNLPLEFKRDFSIAGCSRNLSPFHPCRTMFFLFVVWNKKEIPLFTQLTRSLPNYEYVVITIVIILLENYRQLKYWKSVIVRDLSKIKKNGRIISS